mmetsp:Transcript_46477/g.108268  ORF Transcript_46477/g.108268 Transcript_46477/m.108268 type:complete len:711 (+) Transcript_46477:85-2217(+)
MQLQQGLLYAAVAVCWRLTLAGSDARGQFDWAAGGTAWAAIPPAVVVRGRQGANSNINGVYIRSTDFAGLCFKRGSGNSRSRQDVFLYFSIDWRIGPSPSEEETVWAYASSSATSPVDIDAVWWVWDGRQMVQDARVRVSDASVIPSVLFLSFTAGHDGTAIPAKLRATEGMLMQQPGLWEGRPYYRHETLSDIHLLCSAQEGRWRLGPLPRGRTVSSSQRRGFHEDALLFAYSASTMPHEVEVPWELPLSDGSIGGFGLRDFMVRLATTTNAFGGATAVAATPLILGDRAAYQLLHAGQGSSVPFLQANPHPANRLEEYIEEPSPHKHPRHIVVQGATAWGGMPNGVYSKAQEPFKQRPVYHKTDVLEVSSLWYDNSKWWLGASIGRNEHAWAFAESTSWNPVAVASVWRAPEGQETFLDVTDAAIAIPASVSVQDHVYLQQNRFCDARPVYQRQMTSAATASQDMFLFFRTDESKWCIGPVIGGVQCVATAVGSRLRVIPLHLAWSWEPASPLLVAQGGGAVEEVTSAARSWFGLPAFHMIWMVVLLAAITVALLAAITAFCWRKLVTLRHVEAAELCSMESKTGPQHRTADSSSEGTDKVAQTGRTALTESVVPSRLADLPSGTNDDTASVVSSFSSTSSSSRWKRRSAVSCVVCCDAAREVLLEPCRHVCCCRACALVVESCPLCRSVKTAFTEVYLFREQRRKAA